MTDPAPEPLTDQRLERLSNVARAMLYVSISGDDLLALVEEIIRLRALMALNAEEEVQA